jgi:selenocysteine-specific elongation factor
MIVGTAGHIDHGKSALVRRLTGTDTDRLKEEKARGISIDLGFAYWPRPDGRVIGFVDVPGHEGLIHNMLAGATGIDFVLLVVAADDGVMPQTREHLAILDLLGLGRGFVALNKCDRVDAGRIFAAEIDVRAALANTALADCEILPVSAITGEGIDRLAARLDHALARETRRRTNGRFRLAIDRCFTRAGLGTVVTGTVLSGEARLGDRVMISPIGLEARVRSIHAHNRPAESAMAGERCALVLNGAGVSKERIGRGDLVIDPTLHAPTDRIDARLRILTTEPKPIGQWFPVKVHHAATAVSGRVVLLRDAPIAPGETEFVQLVLDRPVAAAAGDRFIVRDTSSRRTIGGGIFLDLRAPERRRRTIERRAELEALGLAEAHDALARLLQMPRAFLDLNNFFRDRAEASNAAAAVTATLGLETFAIGPSRVGVMPQTWQKIRAEISAKLDAYHAQEPDRPGLGVEQLRLGLTWRLPPALFLAILRRAAELSDVVIDRSWVRRPQHVVRLSEEEASVWRDIRPLIAEEPYRPPRVRGIARAMDMDEDLVRRVLRKTTLKGDVEEIAHDHFFTRAAVETMAQIAIELAGSSPNGQLSTAGFRDRLDNGRKVAVHILEFFDRLGFTKRRKELRYINPSSVSRLLNESKAERPPILATLPVCGGGSSPVGRPDFKSGWGRQTALGGFDSHPPPPPGAIDSAQKCEPENGNAGRARDRVV